VARIYRNAVAPSARNLVGYACRLCHNTSTSTYKAITGALPYALELSVLKRCKRGVSSS
jgi:hypothetical protein